jgi:hypothetical protein
MAAFSAGLLRKELQDLVDRGLTDYAETVQEFMGEAYEHLVGISPFITAYYRTNHSIVLRGPGGQFKTQGALLRPAVKDADPRDFGVYLPNEAGRVADELAKLERFQVGDKIQLSTIVDYAGDVEQKHHVYQETAVAFWLTHTENE